MKQNEITVSFKTALKIGLGIVVASAIASIVVSLLSGLGLAVIGMLSK